MQLEYLSLAHNEITKIQRLRTLKNLLYLDLSENLIHEFDVEEFPQSIALLKMKENPVMDNRESRTRLILGLAELEELDGERVTMVTRFEARGVE